LTLFNKKKKGQIKIGLIFVFTPNYPNEVPEIEIDNVEGLLDSHVNDLISTLSEMVIYLFLSFLFFFFLHLSFS